MPYMWSETHKQSRNFYVEPCWPPLISGRGALPYCTLNSIANWEKRQCSINRFYTTASAKTSGMLIQLPSLSCTSFDQLNISNIRPFISSRNSGLHFYNQYSPFCFLVSLASIIFIFLFVFWAKTKSLKCCSCSW